MEKYKYIRATLILEPTRAVVAKMKKAKASIRGPLTGTLVLKNWHDRPLPPRLEVKGSLKPITAPGTKPKKAKARRARRKAE